jgi:hypothetical protein
MNPVSPSRFSFFRVSMAVILVLSIAALVISNGLSYVLFFVVQGEPAPGWENLAVLVVFAYIGIPALIAAIVGFVLSLIGTVAVAIVNRCIPWAFSTALLLNVLAGGLPFLYFAKLR